MDWAAILRRDGPGPPPGTPTGPPQPGSPSGPPEQLGNPELLIRLSTAPILYGSNVAWMMLGFLILQTYTYFRRSGRDHPLLKFYVYSAVLIQIGQSGLEAFIGYHYLVGGWGDPSVFMAPTVTDLLEPVFDAILGIMVQSFFILRIWNFGRLCKQTAQVVIRCTCVLLGLLSIASFADCIAIPILVTRINNSNMQTVLPQVQAVTTVWAVSSAIVDIVISLCTAIILRHAKSKVYFKETRDMISRVTLITIQTGLFTSFLALWLIIAFLVGHAGTMYTFPSYLLGKSYAISLLANLNARRHQSSSSHKETGQSTTLTPGVSVMARVEVCRDEDDRVISLPKRLQPLPIVPKTEPDPKQPEEPLERRATNEGSALTHQDFLDLGEQNGSPMLLSHPYSAFLLTDGNVGMEDLPEWNKSARSLHVV